MSVMKYTELQDSIKKLSNRGKMGTNNVMIYVIIPFLKSLGYDVFDVDEVNVQDGENTVDVYINDDITMIVSLEDKMSRFERESDRIYLKWDNKPEEITLTLYFKVLREWEEVVTINIMEDDSDKYVDGLVKRITKEQILKSYDEKGERFLTENVLDYKLDNGDWDNEFLMLGLLSELKNPSKDFVTMMAKRLNKDYTTREVDWIEDRLTGIEEKGLVGIVKRMIEEGYIEYNNKTYEGSEEVKGEEVFEEEILSRDLEDNNELEVQNEDTDEEYIEEVENETVGNEDKEGTEGTDDTEGVNEFNRGGFGGYSQEELESAEKDIKEQEGDKGNILGFSREERKDRKKERKLPDLTGLLNPLR